MSKARLSQSVQSGATPAGGGGRFCRWLVAGLAILAPLASAATLNSEEQKLANYLTTASGQQRNKPAMVLDARLSQVARARATDMAKRRYFSHVNPDGNGPNTLVRAAGFPLPAHYSTARPANSIESIGAGYANAAAAWAGWMDSSGHKTHLLATDSFYRDQVAYGIGYYSESGSPYVRYYVIITAPAPSDVLSITSPASGARVLVNEVTVNGVVSGSASVAQLQYRLENTAGTGAWVNGSLPAGSAVGGWSARVNGLALGSNTVRARTLRADGTVLRETTRSVRLAVMKPLTVSVVGDGNVTAGFSGTTQREVGARYTIAGIPGAGMIFGHWEGLPVDAGRDPLRATQSFVMEEGLGVVAHFVPNPFLDRGGRYQGVIVGGTHESSGVVRLSVAPTGAVSGHVITGGVRRNFVARLNSIGTAAVTLPRAGLPPLTLALHLDVAAPGETLAGALSDGTTTFDFTAVRSTNATPARVTVSIDPDAGTPSSPQGYGYAIMNVTANGVAMIAGSLADGRPFQTAATLTANSQFVLYVPLLGTRGALAGSARLAGGALAGDVRWFKPERPLDARHPAAFASDNTLTGSVYVAPVAGVLCIELGDGGAGELVLSSGNLATVLNQPLALGADHRISCTHVAVHTLRVGINPVSGRFGGSFAHPSGGVRTFAGVVVQNVNGARGYFLGATESGAASLVPAS
jgi:uncharacterized protein YkwD